MNVAVNGVQIARKGRSLKIVVVLLRFFHPKNSKIIARNGYRLWTTKKAVSTRVQIMGQRPSDIFASSLEKP